MRKLIFLIFLGTAIVQAQTDSTFVDEKYLEDQLYFQLSYISLLNTPPAISQSGFSFGLGGGFIKDLPVNSRRNIAFGAGMGYGFYNYYFNVKFDQPDSPESDPIVLNNTLRLHMFEIPLEFRYRTSTAEKYKFWRFYPGIKFAYVFVDNLSFGKGGGENARDVIKYNDFLYGLTFSVGYNKWNLNAYYGLNELFGNTLSNDYDFSIADFRMGLIFYVF